MRCIIIFIIVTLFLSAAAGLWAKEAVEIPLIDTPPVIDGKLDDPVWTQAVRFERFITFKPDYGREPTEKTVIYACSDRENFYFAARCFEKDASKIMGTVTRRDNIFGEDFMAFNIDTFYDLQSSYAFVVNPLGIQGDGMTDADELFIGSNPNDPDSVFKVDIASDGSGDMQLSWPIFNSGLRYELYGSTNLVSGGWIYLGSTTSSNLLNSTTNAAMFYRVNVTPNN